MDVVMLGARDIASNMPLSIAMYRLRKRVFGDRLDWSVALSGDMEIDVFDTLSPTYLIARTSRGDVVGAVRLLPSTGPTMLAEQFPYLLGGEAMPRSKTILESSRFCVDTRIGNEPGEGGIHRATLMLFAAMIEYAQRVGAKTIVTATDTRMERILRRSGWILRRIGTPTQMGGMVAVAGFLDASDQVLQQLRTMLGAEAAILMLAETPGLRAD